MACLDENLVDRLVRAKLAEHERTEVEHHLVRCAACRVLVSELMREPMEAAAASTPSQAPTLALSSGTAAGNSSHLFAIGERLADRYRVLRFIAEGGMGEVYEAEDLELHRRVALKTVRSELASDPRVIDRFRREITLAHKVSHPNVCRVFDLGVHQRQERVTFLTMEFLDGETLSERLRRDRFSPQDALPIIEQMAQGLAAAHAVGVVHRDFKSQNVILVPAEGRIRAVVTDFGLAGSSAAASDERGHASIASSGLVGSPAYMAPEQVEGRKADTRADVYAFGVVLFEMLTGTWPFLGPTPMMTAIKRLQQDPPSPLVHVPALDPRWAEVVLRCLARDPNDRYASVLDVPRALMREAALEEQLGMDTLGSGSARASRPRIAAIAASVGGAALISTVAYLVSRPAEMPVPAPASPTPIVSPQALPDMTAPPLAAAAPERPPAQPKADRPSGDRPRVRHGNDDAQRLIKDYPE